jgi:hypothetical protein
MALDIACGVDKVDCNRVEDRPSRGAGAATAKGLPVLPHTIVVRPRAQLAEPIIIEAFESLSAGPWQGAHRAQRPALAARAGCVSEKLVGNRVAALDAGALVQTQALARRRGRTLSLQTEDPEATAFQTENIGTNPSRAARTIRLRHQGCPSLRSSLTRRRCPHGVYLLRVSNMLWRKAPQRHAEKASFFLRFNRVPVVLWADALCGGASGSGAKIKRPELMLRPFRFVIARSTRADRHSASSGRGILSLRRRRLSARPGRARPTCRRRESSKRGFSEDIMPFSSFALDQGVIVVVNHAERSCDALHLLLAGRCGCSGRSRRAQR